MRKSDKMFSQKIIHLASITEMDVCVVNSDLVRIVGTGRYSSLIYDKVKQNSIYYRLFNSNDKYLLIKPRDDIVCNKCEYLHTCANLVHLAVPMTIEKPREVILVLTAAKEHTKKELLNNTSLYLRLVNFISEQIKNENTLYKKEYKCLECLADIIDKNIIIIKNNVIIYANDNMLNLLKLTKQDIQNKTLHEVFSFEREGDSNFEVSAYVDGEKRYFRMICKIVDSSYDIKIVFIETIKMGDVKYFNNYIFCSESVKKAVDIAKKAALSEATVLLEGESGTGKEVFAEGIHYESNRSKAPIICVNCAAIPETLWESEFFGYSEGAFTGAKREGKVGKFQAAHKGTLFLDEIGEMPIAMQAKLLRVLETKTIAPIGSNRSINIDVRIIAATNKNLSNMVEKGLFRKDLFYRLNVIKISIPPLCERKEDIIPLANYFLKASCIKNGRDFIELTSEACELLLKYSWPGNIRELKNTIEYIVTVCNKPYITAEDLPMQIEKSDNNNTSISKISSIKDYEYNALKTCIDLYGLTEEGKRKIQQKLNISRAALYRKIKKYNLNSSK